MSVTLIKPAAVATPIVDHLGNTTGREAKLPKPHYAPEEVAHAILHAAVHPQRDIYVGGTGRLMSLFANAVPQLADKVSARFGEEAQLGDVNDAADDNLHASTGHRATHNDQDRGRTSYYTRAMLDPASPIAAANAIGGALVRGGLVDARSETSMSESLSAARRARPAKPSISVVPSAARSWWPDPVLGSCLQPRSPGSD